MPFPLKIVYRMASLKRMSRPALLQTSTTCQHSELRSRQDQAPVCTFSLNICQVEANTAP